MCTGGLDAHPRSSAPRACPPKDLRSFLLRHHYHEDWAFDEAELEQEPRRPAASYAAYRLADQAPLRDQFFAALDHDLDAPAALRCLEVARVSQHPELEAFVEEAERILGLDF